MRFLWVILLLPGLALSQVAAEGSNLGGLSMNPQNHSSVEGDFRIIFPGGCGKLVTRIPADDAPDVDGMPAIQVIYTFCDRYQKKGEGCSVASYFNVTSEDGGYPGPDQVTERIITSLKLLNATIKEQAPVRKELPDGTVMEGLDVRAADASEEATVWVRGILYEGDIYIMTAWKKDGNLWYDEDYITFFNSFLPGAE
jgi:hypothetical protein